MSELPETRPSLLVRVREHETDAWTEFSQIYRPSIYRIVRRRGWQDADAQDIAQLVLVKIAKAIRGFDPHGKARFRTWLTTICRNTLVDELRRKRSRINIDDVASAEPRISDTVITEAEISDENRRGVFRWAAKQAAAEFSATTWTAFWETAVSGRTAKEVAGSLGMSVGAVYTARSRVMQRLKQIVQEHDDANL